MGLARQQGSISWPVPQIMGEMASLFADDMFHIGCDETHVVNQYVHALPPCECAAPCHMHILARSI